MDDLWQEFGVFPTQDPDAVKGRLTKSDKPTAPVILMATGDGPKGSQSLTWTNIVPKLSALGFRSCLFDFRGLGLSDGDRRNLSIKSGVEDLSAVVKFLREEIGNDAPIGCFASSFGASVVIAAHAIANEFSAIAFKSPASFLPESYALELSMDEFSKWMDDGYSEKLGFDVATIKSALEINLYKCAEFINTPLLVTHGTSDEIVPIYQSFLLRSYWAGECELSVYQNVSHNYSEPGAWDRMAAEVTNWLTRQIIV